MDTASNQAELPIPTQEATKPAPESTPEKEREAGAGVSDSKYVGCTLASLVLAGVGASAWVLYFTDWFPMFLSLLTLGGAFAWISFVAGMLTEDRKKDLQHRFENGFLARPRAWICILLVTGGGLLIVSLAGGTVIVETYGDQEHRALTFTPSGIAEDPATKPRLAQRKSLSPHTSHKFYVWHPLFFQNFRLDISRLPSARLDLALFKRRKVIVPDDLHQRPVVLIRPTYALAQAAAGRPLYLCVERNGEPLIDGERFRGKAVWLGAGAGMPIPQEMETQWKGELQQGQNAMIWLPASGKRQILLDRNDELLVKLVQEGGGAYGKGKKYTVGEDHLIGEVKLDTPRRP